MAEPNDSIDSNVNVFGKQTYFNEDTKFFKDVYVYGRLHYDFESNPVEEFQDVTIKGNLEVFGYASRTGSGIMRIVGHTWSRAVDKYCSCSAVDYACMAGQIAAIDRENAAYGQGCEQQPQSDR